MVPAGTSSRIGGRLRERERDSFVRCKLAAFLPPFCDRTLVHLLSDAGKSVFCNPDLPRHRAAKLSRQDLCGCEEPDGGLRSSLQGDCVGAATKLDGDPVRVAELVVEAQALHRPCQRLIQAAIVQSVSRKPVECGRLDLLVSHALCPLEIFLVEGAGSLPVSEFRARDGQEHRRDQRLVFVAYVLCSPDTVLEERQCCAPLSFVCKGPREPHLRLADARLVTERAMEGQCRFRQDS